MAVHGTLDTWTPNQMLPMVSLYTLQLRAESAQAVFVPASLATVNIHTLLTTDVSITVSARMLRPQIKAYSIFRL